VAGGEVQPLIRGHHASAGVVQLLPGHREFDELEQRVDVELDSEQPVVMVTRRWLHGAAGKAAQRHDPLVDAGPGNSHPGPPGGRDAGMNVAVTLLRHVAAALHEGERGTFGMKGSP
jgi:hypothetical protein